MTSTPLTACLACGSDKLVPFLDLGEQPLANDYIAVPVDVAAGVGLHTQYPLKLNYCPLCFHAQQSLAVDPHLLFDEYDYASGTSATLRGYFDWFVNWTLEQSKVDWSPRVLEIASNDGTLLRKFADEGCDVVGVDPARNLAPIYPTTISTYWSWDALAKLNAVGYVQFDVVVAMNVLGHVADPLTFLTLAKSVLAPGGRIYIQTSQADMLLNCEWDTAYAEHLSFFTVKSFTTLATRAGLIVDNISIVPIHGNSYLFELKADGSPTGDVATRLHFEQEHAFYQPGTYEAMQYQVQMACDNAVSTLDQFQRAGWTIVGYGAAAKFVTFLNTAEITMDIVVDDAPLKQDKYMPGVGAKVISLDDFDKINDHANKVLWIIGAWNFAPEIIGRITNKRPHFNDAFITLMPAVKLWPQSKYESLAIPVGDVEKRTDL